MPDRRDKYYYLAKKDRYRSRAAFKLLEIQTKFGLLRSGQFILEIGSSPGGWTQVISSITGEPVISIDINPMEPVNNAIFIRGKIEDPRTVQEVKDSMATLGIEKFHGIVSDAMAHTSGKQDIDHSASYLICEKVMSLARDLLQKDGFVILKQFYGDLTPQFLNQWKPFFMSSKVTRVAASRDSSSEVYIIFSGFQS